MSRSNHVNLHMGDAGLTPSATLLTNTSLKPWVCLLLPDSAEDVTIAHMSIEQARALRDSLTLALAKADAHIDPAEPVLEMERRLAS